MNDITDRQDVITLVDSFYRQVREHPLLEPIFNEVAKVDWTAHLPKMYSFWATLLLGENSYSGNPMLPHLDLSRKATLDEEAFNAWKQLFNQTVDNLFAGTKAEEAKERAGNIARLMLHKVQSAKAY